MNARKREKLNSWAAEVLGGNAADYSAFGAAILKQLILQELHSRGMRYEH